jgi:hypothetical protein
MISHLAQPEIHPVVAVHLHLRDNARTAEIGGVDVLGINRRHQCPCPKSTP